MIVNPKYATQERERAPETAKAAFCDKVSGLRYYNPTTGRWLSRDPAEEEGGDNLYCFTENNPQSKFDTNGLEVHLANKPDEVIGPPQLARALADTQPVVIGRLLPKIEPYGLEEYDLSFEEGLDVRIRYRTQDIKDDIKTLDRKGLTTRQHELEHARIDADAWNQYAAEANTYERSYKCKECAQIAKRIVKALRAVAFAKMDSENNQHDWDAYGKDSVLDRDDLEKQMHKDAVDLKKTEDDLNLIKEEFKDTGCQ